MELRLQRLDLRLPGLGAQSRRGAARANGVLGRPERPLKQDRVVLMAQRLIALVGDERLELAGGVPRELLLRVPREDHLQVLPPPPFPRGELGPLVGRRHRGLDLRDLLFEQLPPRLAGQQRLLPGEARQDARAGIVHPPGQPFLHLIHPGGRLDEGRLLLQPSVRLEAQPPGPTPEVRERAAALLLRAGQAAAFRLERRRGALPHRRHRHDRRLPVAISRHYGHRPPASVPPSGGRYR